MNKPIYVIAQELAIKYHAGQKYGNDPYVKHLADVQMVLDRFWFGLNPVLVTAVYLHDILEDTPATEQDLMAEGIPIEVIRIVQLVTDQPGKDRHERKMATYPRIASSRRATIVKLADRIANAESGDKIDMYKKEYYVFRKFLYNPDFDLQEMWDHLDKLMDYKD